MQIYNFSQTFTPNFFSSIELLEHGIQDPLFLLIPIASLRVFKITLWFHNVLEGLTEVTENCYTHSYNLLHLKNADQNQSGEKCIGNTRENFKHQASISLIIAMPTR